MWKQIVTLWEKQHLRHLLNDHDYLLLFRAKRQCYWRNIPSDWMGLPPYQLNNEFLNDFCWLKMWKWTSKCWASLESMYNKATFACFIKILYCKWKKKKRNHQQHVDTECEQALNALHDPFRGKNFQLDEDSKKYFQYFPILSLMIMIKQRSVFGTNHHLTEWYIFWLKQQLNFEGASACSTRLSNGFLKQVHHPNKLPTNFSP